MLRPLSLLSFAAVMCGCGMAPPKSPMPNAGSALSRMKEAGSCGNGLQANAKFDHFGEHGRVRGELLLYAVAPASVRMDAVSPFGVTLATLTSDGSRFALSDLRDKVFYSGPAEACNIARLTTLPIPGHVLVSLLRGRAPLLKHDESASSLEWNKSGYYVIRIKSARDAEEEIHLEIDPADFEKPWSEQRLRATDVIVRQKGVVLYHAELGDFFNAPMANSRIDPDGLDAPIPPSGPECTATLPRKIHVEVPNPEQDILFRYDKATWNPPLIEGLFAQRPVGGMITKRVTCGE